MVVLENTKMTTKSGTCHLLRDGLPAFRRAANPPCRFMPRRFGTGSIPFDFLHSSRREPRGPCVETNPGFACN